MSSPGKNPTQSEPTASSSENKGKTVASASDNEAGKLKQSTEVTSETPSTKPSDKTASNNNGKSLVEEPKARILRLCKKNEWGQVDSILRTLTRGALDISFSLVSNLIYCVN